MLLSVRLSVRAAALQALFVPQVGVDSARRLKHRVRAEGRRRRITPCSREVAVLTYGALVVVCRIGVIRVRLPGITITSNHHTRCSSPVPAEIMHKRHCCQVPFPHSRIPVGIRNRRGWSLCRSMTPCRSDRWRITEKRTHRKVNESIRAHSHEALRRCRSSLAQCDSDCSRARCDTPLPQISNESWV